MLRGTFHEAKTPAVGKDCVSFVPPFSILSTVDMMWRTPHTELRWLLTPVRQSLTRCVAARQPLQHGLKFPNSFC
jgi:hypothetical protein